MKAVLSLFALFMMAVLGVWLLWWCRRSLRALRSKAPNPVVPPAAITPSEDQGAPEITGHQPEVSTESDVPKDVQFRPRGERAPGGPVFGDLLCVDGIYLPHVWENDYAISFDGRWIRTGSFANATCSLIDRKTRRSWLLTPQEAALVVVERWKLPRWQESADAALNEEGQSVYSDEAFDAWLSEHVSQPAQDLAAILDLLIPLDCVPPELHQAAPALAAPPEGAACNISLQRVAPASLRALHDPMRPLRCPQWQLIFSDVPQTWGIDQDGQIHWRADGKALAVEGRMLLAGEEAPLQLAAWSLEQGWTHWTQAQPTDRKPWRMATDAAAGGSPAIRWSGDVILQRMAVDIPMLERLHDGRCISHSMGETEGAAGHIRDGRVLLQSIPHTRITWVRQPQNMEVWIARSEPLDKHPLEWSLTKAAADVHGAAACYQLRWREHKIPGEWELEHVIVQGRFAVLMPFGAVPRHGGVRHLHVWDGGHLQRVDVPGAVVRLRPMPVGAGRGPRAEVLVLVGCVADAQVDANAALWRWPVQPASPGPLGQVENSAVYEWRQLGPDEHGFWHVLPRWREVSQIQHPCADGDYVWRFAPGGDELWWWGGVHQAVTNHWSAELPRVDGICVTSGGSVLCGVGPSAMPHPDGKGWAVLELIALVHGEPSRWKLHWLQPDTREVHTLELRAYVPFMLRWDRKGLQWREGHSQEAATAAGGARHLVDAVAWKAAPVERLVEGTHGLWLRKQDQRYADLILARSDWPWQR